MDITYSAHPVRMYSKTSLAVDTSSLMILAADVCTSDNADVKRLPFIVDDLKISGLRIGCVLADKGYDSEVAHRYIRENLDCKTMIPLRKTEPAKLGRLETRTRGFYRGLMKYTFDPAVYKRRSMVETVNSMIKRKMSDIVYGRSERTREIEILCRCVAHNVMRKMTLDVKEV
jgi:transposase